MLLSRAPGFSPFPLSLTSSFPNDNPLASPMRTAVSFLRSLSASASLPHRRNCRGRLLLTAFSPFPISSSPSNPRQLSSSLALSIPPSSASTLIEHQEDSQKWDLSNAVEAGSFEFDASFASSSDMKFLNSSHSLEFKELEQLPEQWRRSKLAWLCKELPSQKPATLVRILNAQRKWITQADLTYVAVHCMRIRENETGFRVYKWMVQQHWFQFDFALATKLADYMGKERKFAKCREVFDDIINKGQIPAESTFHILTIAYLSAPARGCLEQACGIYNRMIQLGGYKPKLSLQNSLFRALVSEPGGTSKHYLKQAEYIFQNLVASGFEIHKDIYGGLIWLHSYQDEIDDERIECLRAALNLAGFEESREVLVSVLRACSKKGDVEEAEKTWKSLMNSGSNIPSQAFVYKMEVYAKVGKPMKSLEAFRNMQEQLGSASTVAFHKIVEVLCKAEDIGLAESLMTEFMRSGLKPLMPAFIDLMEMYLNLNLHDKVESTFCLSLKTCHPNQTICIIYLNSLLQVGRLDKAEEIFVQMQSDGSIGANTRSCNMILHGYLSSEQYPKAEKIYEFMLQKKYDVEPPLMEKLDYILSLSRKVVKKPVSLKLSKEQRENLVGLLLGGLQIKSNSEKGNHIVKFQFDCNSQTHSFLKKHIYHEFHEWLAWLNNRTEDSEDIPDLFVTNPHTYFGFYADQFWPKGQPAIPKLIHRWLSPRVLAYWYMYGGYRTSSGDILLRISGNRDGVERVVMALKAKSFDCRVKHKGKFFWIGLLKGNSTWFWKLVEPFILDDLKDFFRPGGTSSDGTEQTLDVGTSCYSSDENL